MYERAYGYKYDEQKDLDGPGVAKLIRKDINQAVKDGLLPGHWKYSTRFTWATHSWCIDVTVKDCEDAWEVCTGTDHNGLVCRNHWCAANNPSPHANQHDRLTLEGEAAEMTLRRIHGAYNHDGSETQVDYFDVNYYGQVTFQTRDGAEWEAEQKAKNDARKAAREGGTKVGKVANINRQGKKTVHWVVENTEGKKVAMCGVKFWRNSNLYNVTNEDAKVTCTRCAKKGGEV